MPEDAVALFSSKLDIALDKQKRDIFKEIENRIKPPAIESTSKSTPKFRFEGNQKQFDFNIDVLGDISHALDYIKRGSVSSAIKHLDNATESFNKRNKILRIADKYGWDTVEEYIDDPITDGTDDAAKLRQAEYRAKNKRNYKARATAEPYPRNVDKQQEHFFRESGTLFGKQISKPGNIGHGAARVYSSSEYYGGSQQKPGESRCYYCNEVGHWAYACPRKARSYSTGSSFPAGTSGK